MRGEQEGLRGTRPPCLGAGNRAVVRRGSCSSPTRHQKHQHYPTKSCIIATLLEKSRHCDHVIRGQKLDRRWSTGTMLTLALLDEVVQPITCSPWALGCDYVSWLRDDCVSQSIPRIITVIGHMLWRNFAGENLQSYYRIPCTTRR